MGVHAQGAATGTTKLSIQHTVTIHFLVLYSENLLCSRAKSLPCRTGGDNEVKMQTAIMHVVHGTWQNKQILPPPHCEFATDYSSISPVDYFHSDETNHKYYAIAEMLVKSVGRSVIDILKEQRNQFGSSNISAADSCKRGRATSTAVKNIFLLCLAHAPLLYYDWVYCIGVRQLFV